MISSPVNKKVKQAAALGKKAKYRRETGLFVVEGPRMAAELPPEHIESVYVTEQFMKNEPALYKRLQCAPQVEAVTEEVLRAMSDTRNPQGVLVLARQFKYSLQDILKAPGRAHLIVLETIQDPGNLGTILRAGEGAGITGVIMDELTADIYNPKVTRSTMGSIFRVPFVYVADLQAAIRRIQAAGICLYAAQLQGACDYDQADFTKDMGFLVGNEARGLRGDTAALAEGSVRIPMTGHVESLNAAVASAVLMYEAARQRRRQCRG